MGDVIKSFLVGLGFSIDEGSLANFNKAITTAAVRVTALYATVKASAAGIFYAISRISEGFEEMGYQMRLVAPPITKVLQLRQEMLKAYGAAGINIKSAVQQSILFNFSLAKTKYALEAVYKSVGVRFLPLLTRQMDVFRKQIYANMPKIQDALEGFVKFIFKAFEATTILGGRIWTILQRVWDFFKRLDSATNGWSTIVLGLVAAWKLLNLQFLATPLGMIIGGLTALLTLWDDFKTFQEGGESFFNWAAAMPAINAITAAFTSLRSVLQSVFDVFGNLYLAFIQLASGDFGSVFGTFTDVFNSWLAIFSNLWNAIKSIGKVIAEVGAGIGGFIGRQFGGNPNVAANLSNNPTVSPMVNPIGSNVSTSTMNQNMNQNTNITVNGSTDPSSTARSVVGAQNQINANLARNMKGAVR